MQNKKKNTKQKKKGVSLIVLVITIVVMVILGAAVIVSLNNTSILDKAQDAVDKTNAQEEQTASIIESLWNLITGSDTVPVTPPSSNPQEDDEIDTTDWEYAWAYTVTNGVGVWSDTLVKEKGDEIPEGANVVGKLVPNGKMLTAEIDNELPGGNAYTLVISGHGNMGALAVYDENGEVETLYAWQKLMALMYGAELDIENGFDIALRITDIVVQEGITNIGNSAFVMFVRVSNVILPSSLISIEYDSFSACLSLTSITLPGSITSIGKSVFENCTALTSVTISNNDNGISIGKYVFGSCENLESVYVMQIDSTKFELDEKALYGMGTGCTIYVQNEDMQKIFTDAGYNAVVVEE